MSETAGNLDAVVAKHAAELMQPDGYYADLVASSRAFLTHFNGAHDDTPYYEGLVALTPMAIFATRAAFELADANPRNHYSPAEPRRRGFRACREAHNVLEYADETGILNDYTATLGMTDRDIAQAVTDIILPANYEIDSIGHSLTPVVVNPIAETAELTRATVEAANAFGMSTEAVAEMMRTSSGLQIVGAASEVHRTDGKKFEAHDIEITMPDAEQTDALPTARLTRAAIGRLGIQMSRMDGGAKSGCPARFMDDPVHGSVFKAGWGMTIDYLLEVHR